MNLMVPKFKSIHHLLIILSILWIGTFYIQERFITYNTITKCNWPNLSQLVLLQLQLELLLPSPSRANILLIADPQLIDQHTYPGRNKLLLKLSQHTVDIYLKKNYKYLLQHLQPNYVIFLGDLLDNGRGSDDSYFKSQYNRFNKIFYNNYNKRYVQNTNWFTNLPGNHDIGFGDLINTNTRQRFIEHFGDQQIKTINGADLIMLDTPSLSSLNEAINAKSKEFLISNFQNQPKTNHRILLSHVPLYRDPETSCGLYRETKKFDVLGHGYQYQNSLKPDISKYLLDLVQPDLIFSGDDHDYCDVNHHITDGEHEQNFREITVKSISLAMGIKYPAVQLLSYTDEEATFNYDSEICYLQTPYWNIIHYVFMSIISVLMILWWNVKQKPSRFTYTSLLPIYSHSTVNIPFESHSKKIHRFLKEQDEEEKTELIDSPTSSSLSSTTYTLPNTKISSIPKYTFTQTNHSKLSTTFKNSKLGKVYILNKRRMFTFMKRWNLFSFGKNILVLGGIVIAIYYIGFCLTL